MTDDTKTKAAIDIDGVLEMLGGDPFGYLPAEIATLRAHLAASEAAREAAEAECGEQARLNGMGSEREAALMSRLAASESREASLRCELDEARKALRTERTRRVPFAQLNHSRHVDARLREDACEETGEAAEAWHARRGSKEHEELAELGRRLAAVFAVWLAETTRPEGPPDDGCIGLDWCYRHDCTAHECKAAGRETTEAATLRSASSARLREARELLREVCGEAYVKLDSTLLARVAAFLAGEKEGR